MNESLLNSAVELEEPELKVTDIDGTDQPTGVILFNDDWHTFEEVINQIIKAVNCAYEKAEELTLEVHNKGKSLVFTGELVDCIKVSSVLEEIGLHTQIEV